MYTTLVFSLGPSFAMSRYIFVPPVSDYHIGTDSINEYPTQGDIRLSCHHGYSVLALSKHDGSIHLVKFHG